METSYNICRACLKSSSSLMPLFSDTSLPQKIRALSSIVVSQTDNLPSLVCSQCVVNINSAFSFRQILIDSDATLKKRFIEIEDQGDSLCWPFQDDQNELMKRLGATDIKKEATEYPCESTAESHQVLIKAEVFMPERSVSPIDRDEFKAQDVDNQPTRIANRSFKDCSTKSTNSGFKDKNVLCHHCGKGVLQSNLSKHVLTHIEAPVSCKICGKTLKNTVSLRSHMDMHNPPQRTCEYCGKTFKFRSNYIEHVNGHTGNKKYNCTVCDKTFLRGNTLKKHLLSHTGERPYPCEYCKKGFSSRYALKTHVRQHTNERPFVCEYCSMGFPQRVSLKTHLKSKHPEKG